MTSRHRLIAIVGSTATGKTALAIELARAFDGEIVSADSRQVYRFMDIGTAKPTAGEQAMARHHLIDVVNPGEPFGLGTWVDQAAIALQAIWSRDGLPLVVGGTGQYVWALLEGWRVPRVAPQLDLRRELEKRPPEELLQQLREVDPEAESYIDPHNLRRVIRALEVHSVTGKSLSHWRTREPPQFEFLTIGVKLPRDKLYNRIDARVDRMFEAGLVDEVASLRARGYNCDLPAMSGIGYREVCEYLNGSRSLDSAIQGTKMATHRLARHQNSWFKLSDKRILWIDEAEEATNACRQWLTRR
jgi:tRNA dimethylallyltransferase